MNKNLLLSFLLLLASAMMLNAQTVEVTVSVDMTNETVDAEVYISRVTGIQITSGILAQLN